MVQTFSAPAQNERKSYQFKLEAKKKYHCPECKKRKFTRYVNTATGEQLHPTVGMCDRLNNCGHHYTPKEFFKLNPTNKPTFEPSVFQPITTTAYIPNFAHDVEKSYDFKFSAFDSAEYKAVQQHLFLKTGIPTSKQKSFAFEPISSRSNLKNNRVEIFNASNFAFAIVPAGPDFNIKIKNPTAKNKEYKTLFAQSSGNYIYGLSQFPSIEQRKKCTLLICEGEEKAACINYNLSEFGIYAITRGGIMGGSYCPYFDNLRTQFKNVFVWFDNDKAGQDAAQKLQREHNLPFVEHSKYENIKDINDIFTDFGRERLFEIAANEIERLQFSAVQIAQNEIETINRDNAFIFIETDQKEKIIICENSFFELAMPYAQCYAYNEISKIGITSGNIYVFGSSNFKRKNYLNAANEIDRLRKIGNNLIFVAEYTNAKFSAKTILSDSPAAKFVELLKNESPENVQYLDTSESINKQLEPLGFKKIKRSELYAADANKPLYVLYDSNVQLMPDAFLRFKNVIFVLNSEKKVCVLMATFCQSLDKLKRDAMNFIDNDFFKSQIEQSFFSVLKSKKLPLKYDFDLQKVVFCEQHAQILETEHEIKTLYSNPAEFQKYLNRFAQSTIESAPTTEATETIFAEIQHTKKDLAAEKKAEYFELLNLVESQNIKDFGQLSKLIAAIDEPTRGAKIAYSRLKALSKVEHDLQKCFDAVYSYYTGFSKIKGRFYAAKMAQSDTKMGKMLQNFKKETQGKKFEKSELIKIARENLDFLNKSNDKTTWTELKKVCYLTRETARKNEKVVRVYEIIFSESEKPKDYLTTQFVTIFSN